MKNCSFLEYLNSFLTSYLSTQRNVSSNTIRSYKITFKLFLKYIIEIKKIPYKNINFSVLTREIIIDFLNYIEEIKQCSIKTRNQRLAAIKSFCNFVLEEDFDNFNSLQRILTIPQKKGTESSIDYLTKEELTLFLKTIETNNRKGVRDYILIALMYDSAARVSEIINLKVNDLDLTNNPYVTLYGKGKKYRKVPITNETKELLVKYIKTFKLNNFDYLFSGNKGEKATTKMITHIINKYKLKSRINKNIHPHIFRHTRAMHLLEAGVNIVDIRDILGHSSVTTTEIYARTTMELKRKAILGVYNIDTENKDGSWNKDKKILKDLFEL